MHGHLKDIQWYLRNTSTHPLSGVPSRIVFAGSSRDAGRKRLITCQNPMEGLRMPRLSCLIVKHKSGRSAIMWANTQKLSLVCFDHRSSEFTTRLSLYFVLQKFHHLHGHVIFNAECLAIRVYRQFKVQVFENCWGWLDIVRNPGFPKIDAICSVRAPVYLCVFACRTIL